jgi:hypothetical protein
VGHYVYVTKIKCTCLGWSAHARARAHTHTHTHTNVMTMRVMIKDKIFIVKDMSCTVGLLNIQVFWEETLCYWVGGY